MKHLVFMKLEPGRFDAAAEQDFKETFAALQEALPEDILSARVIRNTVERPQNLDVMIEMTLAGPASLATYLAHPLHKAIGARYQPVTLQIGSFDYEG